MTAETVHGVVTGVREDKLGDSLAVAVTVPAFPTTGVSTLTVSDVADFSEDGGKLILGPLTLAYTGVDDDTSTIDLAAPLTSIIGVITLAVDTEVYVWDDANNQVATRYIATVTSIDGSDSDPIEAVVDQGLIHALTQVMRVPGAGESVTLTRDGSVMKLTGIAGRAVALAALQYLQGGLTTRQNDDQPGLDILGADAGTPGLYLYDSNGNPAMWISDDLAGGVIKFSTGAVFETAPGYINPTVVGANPLLEIASPATSGGLSKIQMMAGIINVIQPAATWTEFNRSVVVDANLEAGSINSDTDIDAFGQITGAQLLATAPGTTTNPANVRFAPGGQLVTVTSLTQHKLKPKALTADDVRPILDVDPKAWFDAVEFKANKRRYKGLRRVPGALAEDVAEHVELLADYDENGDLQGVHNDRVGWVLIPLVREQAAQLVDQQARIERLEALVADLTKEN